jgi:hypothetical protein
VQALIRRWNMAEGNFGGGGSVRWSVIVDDDEREDPQKKTEFKECERGCEAHGVDKVHDPDFLVAVRVPGITTTGDFLKWLRRQGNLSVQNGAATFRLPIRDDDAKQISVRWK